MHISVENGSTSILKEYTLFFRVNKSEIDSSYLENGHVIETMISDIKSTLETDGFTPDSLLIYASSSPEGSYSFGHAAGMEHADSLTTHTPKNAEPALLPKSETEEIIPVEEAIQVSEVEQARERAPFYLAAKNNMLYDLVLVPNVGVELYLGNNISLAGNWMYAWWSNYDVHWFWKTYGGDLGVRYWFGKAAAEKPLQGHHVGLYGQIITYDFELGQRGYLGDRWTYGAGVEYGYSFPIARRLNLDLNLCLGFLYGEFKEYLPIDGHYVWQSTKLRQWVGPTKGEISLVWLLGRGNENSKKRGKR